MNNRAPFQVIAIIPDDDDSSTEKVKEAVAQRFDLDLQHYSREFQEEGVCIQHALTLEDALKTTMVVQDLGASCRVLDATGHVVTEGGPSKAPDEDDEPELELDPNQDFSGQAPQTTERDLGVDDLVMLDGAIGDVSDEAIPELADPRVRDGSTAQPEIRADDELDGDPLELDGTDRSHFGTEYEDPGAVEFSELTKDAEARESKAASSPPGRSGADDGGLFKELDDSLSGKPSSLAMASEEEFAQALPRGRAPSMDDAGSRSRRPSQAVAPRGSRPVRASRGSPAMGAATSGTGPVMFGGWFRQRPRARVVVGFLLALGLSSVVPAVHATGQFKAQVKPLLVDLSTARANETRATKSPGIPTSRAVEEKIDKHRTENFAYTLAIWLGCFIGIIILWFRFC